MEAPKQAPVTKLKITRKPVKSSHPNTLMTATQPNQLPSKDFSNLDNILVDACAEITHRILTSVPTLLLGELAHVLSSKPLSSL